MRDGEGADGGGGAPTWTAGLRRGSSSDRSAGWSSGGADDGQQTMQRRKEAVSAAAWADQQAAVGSWWRAMRTPTRNWTTRAAVARRWCGSDAGNGEVTTVARLRRRHGERRDGVVGPIGGVT
ncbi:hypothetical protein Syun_027695 [Stephania yunnanensis]|uniref:Uncharacterized protein n=1 Tax=Stephania yunnanensis TaxID=152371 RepID=A0AAP0EPY0_9MAGN